MGADGVVNSPAKVGELRKIAAFRRMPQDQLDRLAAVMVRQSYAPGQLIFLEGEATSGLWFIADGRVKIIKQSLSGRVQALCLVNRGKCFGSCPLFNNETNPATAQALDHVTLLILDQDDLQRFVTQDPLLAAALLRIFSQRLAHLARLSEGLGAWTASDRINDSLLTYADPGHPHPVVMLTHERLAALAGTVREVVTRHLSQLEKSGVIHLEPGRITLLDMDALRFPCPFET